MPQTRSTSSLSSLARRALLGATLPLLLVACATTSSLPSTPLPADQLNGARYKLLASGAGIDHRVVEFEVSPSGETARGKLVSLGRVLSQRVGVHEGYECFKLSKSERPDEPNTWEGVYRSIEADGRQSDREVRVEFFTDRLTWNLESATWERVE